MKAFLLGLILGLSIIPIALYVYFHTGYPPVAVTDKAFMLETQITRVPLHTRIAKEMPRSAPIEASETNLEGGAHIYRQQIGRAHV